jgi:hypothetical protein
MNVLFQYLRRHKEYSFSPKKYRNRETKKAKTIYVVRLLKNDGISYNVGNCAPCVHCQSFLVKMNVGTVKYTDNINGENVLCEWKLVDD